MLHLATLILFFHLPQALATKPACTLAGLTDNCKAFEKFGKQPRIQLPDGTSFPNPLADGPPIQDPEMAAAGHEGHTHAGMPNTGAQEPEPVNALILEDMRLQAKAMNVFERLSSDKLVNPSFKTELISLMPVPDEILYWAGKRLIYPPGMRVPKTDRVTITWPPGDPQAQRQTISMSEIVSWLDRLPAPYKSQMRAVFQSRATVKAAYLNSPESRAPGPAPLNGVLPKRVSDIIEFSKKTLSDELLKGRDAQALSEAERAAIKRIETVQFQVSGPQTPLCQTFNQSPAYQPQFHRFNLCGPNLNLPSSILVRLISHEIMHSFDPCTQTLPFYKINRNALQRISNAQPSQWPDAFRKDRVLIDLLQVYASQPNLGFAILDDKLSKESREALQKAGVLEVIDGGFPLQQSPAKNAYTCLRDAGFEEVDEPALTTIANRVYDKITSDLEKPPDRQSFTSVFKDRMKPSAQCLRGVPGVHSHMGEVMCDAWASKVLGKWYGQNPPRTAMDKIGAFGIEAGSACSASVQTTVKDPSRIHMGSVPQVTSPMLELHPAWKPRAEKILFADARIQGALDCAPDATQNCLSKMGTNSELRQSPSRPVRANQSERISK